MRPRKTGLVPTRDFEGESLRLPEPHVVPVHTPRYATPRERGAGCPWRPLLRSPPPSDAGAVPSSSAERGSRPVLLFPHVRVRPQAGPALPLTRCAGRGGCERPGLGAGPVCPGPWSPSTSRGGAGVDLNAVFNVPLPAGARASGTGAPERLLSLTRAQRCPHPQGPAPLGGRCSALQASVSALCPSWGPWAAGSGGEGLRA